MQEKLNKKIKRQIHNSFEAFIYKNHSEQLPVKVVIESSRFVERTDFVNTISFLS